MHKARAHGHGIGKEGDAAHLGATHGTHERENLVDAGEQQRPGMAGGAPMRRFNPVSTQLADRAALPALLVEHFGFDLPEVLHLRVPSIPEWGSCA